jgi:hypothetical protein
LAYTALNGFDNASSKIAGYSPTFQHGELENSLRFATFRLSHDKNA